MNSRAATRAGVSEHTSFTHAGRRRLRRGAFAAIMGLLVGLVPTMMSSPAGAAPAAHLQTTFEGCKGSVASFPAGADEEADFVCPDSEYTTGNLGPGWNELDLVPHRLSTTLGSQSDATPNYTLNITADHEEAGTPGYDYISVPHVNVAKSHASCFVSAGALLIKDPGIGGTDKSMYRTLSIHQNKGTTCVFDYVERLAVGSSGFSGSSLHSNLTQEDFSTGGIGARDISIPVKPIQPQSIDKDMTATQGADHVWNVTKSATPASLTFADTCAAGTGARQAGVSITVEWQKLDASPSGDITVVTNIYATNPAHRSITVNVSDDIRSGTTLLDNHVFAPTVVLANTANFLIGTHQITVPAGTTNLNDIATASYTDTITNIPVPGTTTATASATVQQSGSADNETATITDVESITGTGLSFSVDSFTPDVGSYDGGYVEGTETANNVSWTSDVQSGDGSVTFQKTVYVDEPRQTSGTLSDTATLTGSEGFTTDASAEVAITTDATVTLTISKTIPNILQGAETVSFTFNVYTDKTDPTTQVASEVLTFTAGQTSKSVDISLDPGVYDIVEVVPAGWGQPPDKNDVDLQLPSCDSTVSFANFFGPATARALKITDPAGSENGWVMCLEGPGTEALNPGTADAGKECVTTSGGGEAPFTTSLGEGSYTITEKPQAGWDQTGSSGDCSFTVNYPADFDAVFTCTFTNTQRGTVTVIKTSSGQVPPAGAFTFEIRSGASATELGTVLATDSNDATGEVDFDSLLPDGLQPGAYEICESSMAPGWHSTLSDDPASFVPNSDDPNVDNSVICVPFTLDPGEDVVFNVDNTPPPGGDARTIGYWRNWSSCSGGKQAPTLDETLASAGGILIGDLLVDTCLEGVRILSKQDLNGVNRASDPAFNMAAQLLAAFLNEEAGAVVCPAAATAMASGQTLLANADFDGYRTFGGSSTHGKKGSASTGTINAGTANALASTLDAYNNNELC